MVVPWAVPLVLWLPIYVWKQSKRWPSTQLLFHLKYGNVTLTTVSASLKETQLALSIIHLTLLINTSPPELTHVTDALRFNNYPQNVISNILKKKSSTQRTNAIPTPEELVCMFFKWAAPSDFSNYAVLPYINGISQPLIRLLKKHDVRVVSKPFKTLQQEFPSPKSRPPIDLQPNVVYKIPCADCPWNYVGETGRCFETRKKEHMRNVKSFARGSNIAKHAWSSNHSIDFKNSQVIDKGSSRIRKTLESWHTASTSHADNNSRPLPNQYSILLKKNN